MSYKSFETLPSQTNTSFLNSDLNRFQDDELYLHILKTE